MEMTGKYLINSSQEEVWAALNDPAVLEQCIPGCSSLSQTSDTEFEAEVVAKIGPVKAKFKTSVALLNIEAPTSYTLVGSSKAGAAGFGKGQAEVTLTSLDEGTELNYAADFKVGGKLAQIGSRLVAGATKKTADDFFGNFSEMLDQKKKESNEDMTASSSQGSGSPGVPEASANETGLAKWALAVLASAVIVAVFVWFD